MRKITLSLLLCAFSLTVRAQFTPSGSNPHSLKWMQLETPIYRIIYPSGTDSLARVYAVLMEQMRLPVSGSCGFIPNQNWKNRMDVILDPLTYSANGMVTWTPRRVELYTVPDAYDPLPCPMPEHLVLHESRHIAQMQYLNHRWMKPFQWLSGQLFGGAAAALYCGPAFLEGDAVVAETALTRSGRGRTGDFLEYWRVSADEGLSRNWWQWRWGSLNRYTPDHYTLGYITMGGIRAHYDAPDFTKRYFDRLGKHFFPFFNFQKTIKEVTGKTFRESFKEVTAALDSTWSAEREARAPFQTSVPLEKTPRHYTEYGGTVAGDGCLYAIKSSMSNIRRLVRILPDGREKTLSTFAYGTSNLSYESAGKRLWWSEGDPDLRWEMKSSSAIRFMDAKGRTGQLLSGVRAYHPAPAPDGAFLAVTLYPAEGGSAALILPLREGLEQYRIDAPDSLQIVETAWTADGLYASAVSAGGTGIYSLPEFAPVLVPSPVKIKQLRGDGDRLLFVSDLSGVNELYSLDPGDGRTLRLSSTRNGASSFCFLGDTLYCSVPSSRGRLIHKVSARTAPQSADFTRPHRYAMADKLSAGEPLPITDTLPAPDGSPRRYRRFPHLFRLHSWLPFYVDYDALQSLSLESIASSAGLGATAFFQNSLGDFSAMAGYHARPADGTWRHSGHLKLTYSGLYPVFELSGDISSAHPSAMTLSKDEEGQWALSRTDRRAPLVTGSLNTYVPLRRAAFGLTFGAVPQLSFAISNSSFEGRPLSRIAAAFRAYVLTATPSSCIYPKWGAGLSAGYAARPGLGQYFRSNSYIQAYGYVPGFQETHGIRLSVISEAISGEGPLSEAYASTSPRGLSGITTAMARYGRQGKLSFDYAFPFAPLDWALGPVTYLRNLEAYVQADWSWYRDKSSSGSLGSLGGTLNLKLGNLLWIPYDTRIGVCAYWNFGSLMGSDPLKDQKPWYVGAVFSVDI
ncbi:MAG: hypothetical protein IJS62_07915 [Bacteroidales bacterium]|nr:hypothetical protein [Bacteroidales bacterium]